MADFGQIQRLRDYLVGVRNQRRRVVEFDMAHFKDISYPEDNRVCKTTACLGGFAVLMERPRVFDGRKGSIEAAAREILGLGFTEGNYMFFGDWGDWGSSAMNASLDDAINYLDKVIRERSVMVKVPIRGKH